MGSATLTLAGRYRLESPIAGGGVGEVWRAWDAVLGRAVAVKLLRAEFAGHPETLARFRAEAHHAGGLSHPGIAQVYDYGEDGRPFLVMELVDGPSLAAVLRQGPLDAGSAMDVVAQAALALAAAHEAGLVHRDIKPGNLLIGAGGQVKVTDFGIAHAAGSAPLTQTGALIGTPAYLAPERVAGRPATAASDLYSLGIVCWEALSGAPPFTGTPVEVALARSQGQLPPLPPRVPAEVAALVAALTAYDPAARPASAGDAARWAARLRDAQGAGGTTRQGGWRAGQPSALAGLLPGTLADARQASAQPPTLADTRTAALPPPPAPERRRWPRGLTGRRRMLALGAAAAGLVAALAVWLAAGGARTPGPARHQAGPAAVSTSPSAVRMVQVNQAALAGQPVGAVRRQLSRSGLRVRVTWQYNGRQEPGTVTSVQPAGQVPVGTTILVTGALAPPGQSGRHGNSHGHGNGNGQGG